MYRYAIASSTVRKSKCYLEDLSSSQDKSLCLRWDSSLAAEAKASTLDPFLGIIAGSQPQPHLEQRKERGKKKGVSIV